MSAAYEDINRVMFDFGDKKAKAKTIEDHELYGAALDALLKVNWAAFCKRGAVISKEIKTEAA